MKDIQAVEIIFENCESVKIESKYFGEFVLKDFSKEIYRLASNSIGSIETANTVAFELFSEGNKEYQPFGMPNEETTYIFQRLQNYLDITSFRIFYSENSYEDYYVNYEEEDDNLPFGSPNKNQKIYLSDLGNLYIVISENKNIEDFFEKEMINDKEYIDFHKKMIID